MSFICSLLLSEKRKRPSLFNVAADRMKAGAKCHHDLRSGDDSNSHTHKQCNTRDDVMEVARAFCANSASVQARTMPAVVPMQKRNGSGIDRTTKVILWRR
jgi:hypothetical protein